jgi:putative transposase
LGGFGATKPSPRGQDRHEEGIRPKVVTTGEALKLPLPAEIPEALGELAGAARDGLLALSVGLGLRVVHDLVEAEVTEFVGPKGNHDRERTAKRHGHEDGSMTLGGRRVPVSRPRVADRG